MARRENKESEMFARTTRLLLRPGWIEDAPALARAIGDEAIVRNLATAPWPYGIEDAASFLGREPDPTRPNMLIFARTHGVPRLVGGIGIGETPAGAVELGYWIARPFWGLGFATEAGQAVMAAARDTLRLPPLVAGHFVDNPASGRVLRKLGFRPSGTVSRRFCLARGREVECVDYVESAQSAGAAAALLEVA
jgi:RimJ/RimL family protein N-acetyltransferase